MMAFFRVWESNIGKKFLCDGCHGLVWFYHFTDASKMIFQRTELAVEPQDDATNRPLFGLTGRYFVLFLHFFAVLLGQFGIRCYFCGVLCDYPLSMRGG